MHEYSITHWILFFFIYAFVGWIWECLYVAVRDLYNNKKLKFVNRGFLHGPVIPIYGFAAIAILMATIPVRENTYAVFILGMLAATAFELATGILMEKMFKVKYWDYSEVPLNYKGHICLIVSIVWGLFSVLLVKIIHVSVEGMVGRMQMMLCEILVFVGLILFTGDTMKSFNEAMDLKEILEAISDNKVLKRIERRVDAIYAFTPIPDINELRDIRQNFIKKINKKFDHVLKLLKRNSRAKSEKYQEVLNVIKKWIEE